MKGKKCTLILNNRWGYEYTPIECDSIAEARRRGKDFFGFAYRIFVKGDNGKIERVIHGFCDND